MLFPCTPRKNTHPIRMRSWLLPAFLLLSCGWQGKAERHLHECQFQAAALASAACSGNTDPSQRSLCTAAGTIVLFDHCYFEESTLFDDDD